jgi:hypothetical protein
MDEEYLVRIHSQTWTGGMKSIEKGEPKGTFCKSNGISVDVVDSPLV